MPRLIKDKSSIEWMRVHDHTTRRLMELRDELETPHLSAEDTELLRGQILYAREILLLDQDEDVADVPDTTYLPES